MTRDHVKEWETEARAEAAKLGLGLRDYARLKTIQRHEARRLWERDHPEEVKAIIDGYGGGQ